MLRLDFAREARWVDLGHSVEVLVAPVTASVLVAAREGDEVGDLELRLRAGERVEQRYGAALARAVAQIVIREWRGVGDPDGAPAAVTPEGIDALLEHLFALSAFSERVIGPALERQAEGNDSRPAPVGDGAAAPSTATPARRAARNARNG